MEFVTRSNILTHERFLLLDFLHELSDELHLLVSSTKDIFLPELVLFTELCLFLCDSRFYNPIDSVDNT